MPIKGLTDRGLAFPQIGTIRKGQKETRVNKQGKEVTVPVDLEYFRVIFDEQETEAMLRFLEVYGKEPTEIRVIFPFNELDMVWNAYLEAHTFGRMVAKSDGEIYLYRENPKTHRPQVINGIDVETGLPVPYNPAEPAGFNKEGEPIFCDPVGRLRLVIPELGRAAYMLLITGSNIDVANLDSQLKAYVSLTNNHIAGIPFILKRRPRLVSVPINKEKTERTRKEMWLLSIEADIPWVKMKLEEISRSALPSLTSGEGQPALEIDAQARDITEEISPHDAEGSTNTASVPPPPAAEISETVTETTNQRPYPPAVLKLKLENLAKAFQENCPRVDRPLVLFALQEAVTGLESYNTVDEDVNILLKYLTNLDAFKDLPDYWVATLRRWLEPFTSSDNSVAITARAKQETKMIFDTFTKTD